jgi:hypothetical protein
MTLIIDSKLSTPETHVLLTGVGAYPYLKGGAKKRQIFIHHENMGQLDSPPYSVRALADWFLSEFSNPTVPLGSLEILVSGGPAEYEIPDKKKVKLGAASVRNAETAIKAWADRCDRNAENMAVFYFCGHGVLSGQELSLLLEDFGSDTDMPFKDAIAFSKFRIGMRRRVVRNQCFFLDACRSVSEEYLLTYGGEFTGMPIISGALTSAIPGTQSQVFYASELGTAAYGAKGKPSVFTQGLLAAITGMAGWQDESGWSVRTSRLAEAINAHADKQMFVEKMPEQLCEADGVAKAIEFHRLKGEPRIPVLVRCEPPEATKLADFLCLKAGQEVAKGNCGMFPVWQTELSPDRYDFHAVFPPNPKTFLDGVALGRHVWPPLTPVRIEVQR